MPLPVTSGLLCQLRADLGTWQDTGAITPASADGNPVRLWQDQSGAGRHVTAGADINRPLLRLAVVNGQAVLRFDGTDDYLKWAAAAFAGITAAEVFLVVKKVTSDDGTAYWQMGGSGSIERHRFSDGHMYDGAFSTVRPDCGTLGGSLAAWRLHNVVSQAGEFTVRLDGTQIFTTATNTVATTDPGSIGRTLAYSGANYAACDIAEYVAYNR